MLVNRSGELTRASRARIQQKPSARAAVQASFIAFTEVYRTKIAGPGW
jgi:hypothetical protein